MLKNNDHQIFNRNYKNMPFVKKKLISTLTKVSYSDC